MILNRLKKKIAPQQKRLTENKYSLNSLIVNINESSKTSKTAEGVARNEEFTQ
jgi:hypothetical protein